MTVEKLSLGCWGISNIIRRSKVAYGFAATLAVVLALTSDLAWAEGRCPPGQYPIGGQGAGGCAPIPASQGEGSSGPRAIGKWIKTWGALSRSVVTGDVGASVGKRSKAEAVAEAQSRCATCGAKDCSVGITYKKPVRRLCGSGSGL